MAKSGKSGRGKRRERRFEARAVANPFVVKVVGAVGAMGLGAGFFGQFGDKLRAEPLGVEPFRYAPYILAAGAFLTGVAVWFGTSGEPALRVGDPGVATERGGLRRIAWHAVTRVRFQDGAVMVEGKDEAGGPLTIVASLKSQPQAAAWIVREAKERLGMAVEIPSGETMPEPLAVGEVLTAPPVQVVGKRCAESGKVIAFEPDAKVCTRCERVFHKEHVPSACTCGAPLDAAKDPPLQASTAG